MNACSTSPDKRVVVVGLGTSGIAACRLLASRGARRSSATDAKPRETRLGRGRARSRREGVTLVARRPRRARDFDERRPRRRLAGRAVVPGARGRRARGRPHLGRGRARGRRRSRSAGARSSPSAAPTARARRRRSSARSSSAPGKRDVRRRQPRRAARRARRRAVRRRSSSRSRASRWSASTRSARSVARAPQRHARSPRSLPERSTPTRDAKGNAFVRQTPDDVAVVPDGDARLPARRRRAARAASSRSAPAATSTCDADADRRSPRARRYPRAKHRASRAGTTRSTSPRRSRRSRPFGVDAATSSRDVLASFRGLPHRMAFVARDRAAFATTTTRRAPTSAPSVTALRGIVEQRVVLIAGGRDKGGSYGPLVDALREKGRAAVAHRRGRGAHRATPIGDVVAGRASRRRWTRPCASPPSSRSPATRCCSRPRARASTCSATTRTAATRSSRAVRALATRDRRRP